MSTPVARKCLAVHNKYRTHHHSPPMTWSFELEQEAQQYAMFLLTNGGFLTPKKGSDLGQNVFQLKKVGHDLEYVDDEMAVERAIDTWYEDIKDYDPQEPGSKGRSFSQLIWPTSTHLGIGVASKQTAGSLNIIVIAFYNPRANYEEPSQFNVSVQPLLNSTKNSSTSYSTSENVSHMNAGINSRSTNSNALDSTSASQRIIKMSQENQNEDRKFEFKFSNQIQNQNSQKLNRELDNKTRQITTMEEPVKNTQNIERNENITNATPQKQPEQHLESRKIFVQSENQQNSSPKSNFESKWKQNEPEKSKWTQSTKSEAPINIEIKRLDETCQSSLNTEVNLGDRPIQIFRSNDLTSGQERVTNSGGSSNLMDQSDRSSSNFFNEQLSSSSSSSMMSKRSFSSMTTMSSGQFYEEFSSSQSNQQHQM